MEKVVIQSYEDFEKLVGQQIGISDYIELTQERINLFADATLDHQWIHVDPERARIESPFHSTIAHGYLTLSLLPHLWNQIIEVHNLKMMINYGMDKMKFGQPVLVGQSIRLVAKLQSLTNLRGVAKAEIKFAIEIKDQPKKALEGIAIFLYYFNWESTQKKGLRYYSERNPFLLLFLKFIHLIKTVIPRAISNKQRSHHPNQQTKHEEDSNHD